ncbi:MAG: hypothetical protein DMG57_36505, partial [Acidobacteria bacterium]
NTGEAIANLEKSLAIDGSDVQTKQELALCYIKKANYVKAHTLLEEVVAKQPELASAHVALAQTYYKLKKTADGNRERAIVARLQAAERERQAQIRNSAARQ